MSRRRDFVKYDLNTAENTTPVIDLADFAAGAVHIPTGSSITTLTYHGYDPISDKYTPMYSQAGEALVQTVAGGRNIECPTAIYMQSKIKITTNAAGPVVLTLVD